MQIETGQPVPRTEDPRLLTGKGKYTDDFNLPHQVYAVFLRSPHAHAEINSIDTTAAAAMPGVVAVLTGQDYADDGLGEIIGGSPRRRRDGSTMYRPPRPALTKDRVRFVGQPVVIVMAETVDQAKDAVEAVVVDFTPLPVVMSTADANQDGTPAIWDDVPENESFFYTVGDADAVDAAFEKADHIVTQQFEIPRITANTMEPRGALGHYDAGRDGYTIYVGHQRPYVFRTSLTKNLFKIGENQLSLVTGDMGGSFGMKGSIYPEMPLTAWASKRIGRPVKWICERSEAHIADDHARDNSTLAELALDKDGTFLGLRVRTNGALGAYVAFLGMGPSTGNIGGLAGLYRTPAMRVEVAGVFMNKNPISPYRGAGRPEASYIIESMVDKAARELGMDRVELRRKNFIPPEAMPYKTPLTFTYDCGEFEALVNRCVEKADYAGFPARKAASEEKGKLRGLGISCTIEQAAAAQPETAEMRFDPSGTLTVLVGSTPHGQGHETIYKQLICEKLGIDPDRIRVIEGDTDKVSFGTGTGGSRTAAIGTSAVNMAVGKVIDKARKVAAHVLEASEADIEFTDHAFTVAGTDKSLPFLEAAQAAFQPAKIPDDMEPGLYEIATFSPKTATFPYGCHICEVEVDPDTGALTMEKYTVVDDVGYELNPLLVKGQIHGGVAQGAGQALMEEMVYDDNGQLLSGSFMDYAMPRAEDLCLFDIEGRPVPTKSNPLGVKGAGECGTVGALAAIPNAILDALAPLGVEHLDVPLSPEKIWQAIQGAKAG